MSIKKYRYSVFVFFILLFPFGSQIALGQAANPENTPQASTEIDRLNRQIEEQKAEIKKLREDLKEESEQRKAQQKILEKLAEKLDKLDTSLAEITNAAGDKKVEIVPAVLEKPQSADAAAPTATQDKTLTSTTNQDKTTVSAKQTDKPQNIVETGLGKVKFNGLFQAWYAGGNRGFNDTFRIRRAELKFTGDLLPKVRWTVMLDLAKALSLNTTSSSIGGTSVIRDVSVNQSSRILQEAFVTLSYFKRANVNIGQFKLPVSQEALQSSSALDTIERALFLTDRARGGALGDVRDFGVMAFGPLNKQVDYQIGVFNGSGETPNDVDRSDQKALAGRLVFRPDFIKGLQVGGSGVWGNGQRSTNPRRDRLGAELVYERQRLKFKTELMTGVDGEIHRRGYYAHFGYRFLPKLEGIFRFDMFDPDIRRETNSANVTERDFIAGINYYFKDNNFKLQVNYLRKTFSNNIVESRNQFMVNLQTAW
jgi:phosphate-selective porin